MECWIIQMHTCNVKGADLISDIYTSEDAVHDAACDWILRQITSMQKCGILPKEARKINFKKLIESIKDNHDIYYNIICPWNEIAGKTKHLHMIYIRRKAVLSGPVKC